MFAFTKLMQAMVASGTVSDPQFYLTTLLLNTSSTNGAQNNTFLDSSSSPLTITRNGNVTQGTFTPFSQTGWSYYFDGNINCDLQTPSNAAFGYGTGDFCLEAFVYQQSNANARVIDHTAGAFNFGLLSNGVVTLFDGTTTHSTATSLVPLNTWTHICATRQGSTLRLFVNGVLRYNTSFTVSKADSAVNIGSNPGSGGETLLGYISNLRIVKGGVPSAYSTSSTTNGTTVFTPSTTPLSASESLTAGSLSLLTCQSNRFVDNSANAFAISVTAGTPSVQAFSPFLPTAAYDTAVVGGSGYFDGSSDYLQAPNNAAFQFSGAFTIEMWVYPTQVTARADLVTTPTSGSSASGIFFFINSSAAPFFGSGAASFITSSKTVSPNTWTHLALTRDGSNVATIWVNGVSGGTATVTQNFSDGNLYVGTENALGNYFQGYMSSVRVVKGTAVYTTTFTPPTAPLTAVTNTSLLLNFTNAGIYDSASKNVLETVGNAQVSTTQAKWGTTSMYFDGTGDYLTSVSKPLFDLGKGDWTIEFWINPTAPSVAAGIMTRINFSGNTGWGVIYYPNYLTFVIGSGAPSIQSATNSITAGSWQHVAITRSGTSGKIFINGTQSGSTGTINDFTDASTLLGIGALSTVTGWNSDYFMTGYIDDLRITKGYARYTTTFTPPTAAFPLQ